MTSDAAAPSCIVIVRPAFEQDLQQINLIYGHHALTGAGTFDDAMLPLEEMRKRWIRVVGGGFPFIVATPEADPGRVVGFAYAQPFRERAAYAGTVEDSVYVAPSWERRGVGLAVLNLLLKDLTEMGLREVIALIGDSSNAASIGLHARAGFRHAGVLRGVGSKFGRSVDVVLMQRTLTQ